MNRRNHFLLNRHQELLNESNFYLWSDYVQNGLILQYDAIQNTRKGHNSNSLIWEDLSSTQYDTSQKIGDVIINDKSVAFNGGYFPYNAINNILPVYWEIVLKPNRIIPNDSCILIRTKRDSGSAYLSALALQGNELIFSNISKIEIDNSLVSISSNGYINFAKKDITPKTQINLDRGNGGIGGRSNGLRFYGDICAIRGYSRILTEEETLKNQKIDIKRFNIT